MSDIEDLRAAIAALEGQRATLGDAVLELASAPLRARLAELTRPSGLKHRQVAVLFVDVAGSTALALTLGAEDTLAFLGGTVRRMADVVLAHQGRVLRFTGDGVKAAFGMDAAREDDAERAVRAGLAMLAAGREQAQVAQRQYGLPDFAVRVGVHSGDVALGAGVEADNTAMGAAVNIAARMEQSAPPGTLRISHDTWNLVRGLFEFEPQPPLIVKGVDAPMQTYLVRGALDRHLASVERGLQGLATPMVGRDAELQRLLDTVAQARQTGQLQALTLVGDAGLGKSRLLRELGARLSGQRLLTLRAQPDGLLRPWGLLRTLLAVQCGVADADSSEVARRRVQDGLAPWFDERGERQAQLVGQLAGLDFGDSPHVRGLDPRELRDQAFAAVVLYLQALAARGDSPPVLVVEDLHWADDGSLDLLQHLQGLAAELPLALIITARPALLERRPHWDQPDGLLPLRPLAAAASDALVQALLQPMERVPPPLAELIVGRAEGNPYYAEELVRRLIEDGTIVVGKPYWTFRAERLDTLRLPGTLVGLLQARLDALPHAERQAARQASVIGHVFWDDALQALDPAAPQALPALQRAAIVRRHETSDFEGSPERQFDHHLLHQVTYDTLLKAERRLGHGAAARWLLARTKDRGAEFLGMTGEHAERAGEAALAIDCFEQAGKAALRRFANIAAGAWLRRALVLLGESDPARRFALLVELQSIADNVGDRAGQDALHAEMAAVLERHPDDARQAQLWYSRALLADRRSDRALTEQHARRAVEEAERCGAAETAALSHGLLTSMHIVRHEYPAALAHVEPGLRWAARMDAGRERALAEARLMTLSGMVSSRLGRYEDARATLLDVVARGETLGAPRVQLAALDVLAVVEADSGRVDDLARCGERMLALAESSGNLPGIVKAQWRLTRAATLRGDIAVQRYWCERNLPMARAVGDRTLEASTLGRLASVQQRQGNPAAALLLHQQAHAVYSATGAPLFACQCIAFSSECELELGRPEAALSAVNAALDELSGALSAVQPQHTLGMRFKCHEVLTKLGDARAAALLDTLHADVQAEVSKLTGPDGRERLIQDRPVFRDIVAAYRAMHGQPTAAV